MKDPAILLYTSDFLSGTYGMSHEEVGQFITLVCLQQLNGHLSMDFIKSAVGQLSPRVMAKLVVDENGLYYNERTDYEIERRRKYSQRQSEKVKKRWNNSLSQNKNGNTAVLPDTAVLPIETEKEKEIETGTGTGTEKGTEKDPACDRYRDDILAAMAEDEEMPELSEEQKDALVVHTIRRCRSMHFMPVEPMLGVCRESFLKELGIPYGQTGQNQPKSVPKGERDGKKSWKQPISRTSGLCPGP